MRALRQLTFALAAGFVLFFYSERLFWTVVWPGTSVVELAATWLVYSAFAYLFLAVESSLRATGAAAGMLAGAVYGWLVEGGIASTLYGTEPSAPWPWSVSITGLSWHALLSVMVGWRLTGWALAARTPWPLAAVHAAVGCFWGVWAMFPRQETPPVAASVGEFAGHGVTCALLLAVSWRVLSWAGADGFKPGWLGSAIAIAVVGLFYSQHVTSLGWRTALMPALLAVAIGTLAVRRGERATVEYRAMRDGWRAWMGFAVLPVVATAVFAIGVELRWASLPVAQVVYAIGGMLGFVAFGAAVIVAVRPTGTR
jgi:hypothetical protein